MSSTHPETVRVVGGADAIEQRPHELVERKGVGHPDTMCDAMAERMSRYYAQYCLEHFGGIAHHWFDKVMLLGGAADVGYGCGELTKPYSVIVAGKGAFRCGNQEIPMEEILFRAASDVLGEVTTGFEAERHLRLECRVVDHQGAGRGCSRYEPRGPQDLVAIDSADRVSNDCNLLHGYAPMSRLEALVLGVERYINGQDFKQTFSDTGWDVKVFGSRSHDDFRLIVNMPFLASQVTSLDDYFERKKVCEEAVSEYLARVHDVRPQLLFNPTDRNNLPYLTALGSVADTGDVGVVGRGNRFNGLITPMRPMSIEAPAGKNPLDHTGKLYSVSANRLAHGAHDLLGTGVEVHIFTSKEAPLTDPDEIVVRVQGESVSGSDGEAVRKLAHDILEAMPSLTRELVYDGIPMW